MTWRPLQRDAILKVNLAAVVLVTLAAAAVRVPVGPVAVSHPVSVVQQVGQFVCTGHRTERERERIVLFNDTLNTFYLRLYGVRHMVKDHSEGEKGNPLPPHRLLLSINSKGSFICTIPQTG